MSDTKPMSYASHFSRFLNADPGRLHLAAHSHHGWPDVTEAAHAQAWTDAITLADRKWDKVFGEVVPAFQRHVAGRLNLPDPGTIAIAPNTFDLVRRLLSCLPDDRTPRILTSDAEFHSFTRQTARLEEDGLIEVTRVPAEPFDSFEERFRQAASVGGFDLVFVSHVFFDSGFVLQDLDSLFAAVPDDETLVVIDGYHGFMARPTDLSAIAHRAFYLAGGYKYAMAGEGACFMHCPPGIAPRPRDTGWYAAFGAIAGAANQVGYASDGGRFLGATFDPTGLYRFNAVMDWLDGLGLPVGEIDAHVQGVMTAFLTALDARPVAGLTPDILLRDPNEGPTGHFLTFRNDEAGAIHDRLMTANVIVDHRRDRLRFGFALYHDADQAASYVERIAAALTA